VSASAHNTISLLGQEIGPKSLKLVGSELSSIERDGDTYKLAGTAERPGLFTQHREIRYRPGELLVIRDEVSSEQDRQFVSSLHLARDLIPQPVAQGFDVILPDGKTVKARLNETDCRIETARGQKNPYLGWQSVSYLKMEPATVVRAICPGRKRSITWNVGLQ